MPQEPGNTSLHTLMAKSKVEINKLPRLLLYIVNLQILVYMEITA